MSNKLTS